MTKEEKKLVLQDLCARLPYHVMVHYHNQYNENGKDVVYDDDRVFEYFDAETIESDIDEPDINYWPYDYWKPYLRPMSSMTEDEKEELKYEIELELQALEGEDGHNTVSAAPAAFEIDFYNKHHIDYRGLIPMGLALEAPKGMYKTE